jgi:hypothetical protein
MTAPQFSARYPAKICRRGKGLMRIKVLHPLRRIPFRLTEARKRVYSVSGGSIDDFR